MSHHTNIHVDQTFNVGVNPAGMAITPDDKYAYVANSNNYSIPGSDTVTVLDLKKGLVKTTIHHPSFDGPYRIAIDDCGKFAYVCNSESPRIQGLPGTLSIIDIKQNQVVGTISGFDGPGGIVISKNIGYVVNYGADGGLVSGNGKTVSVVDLKQRRIINTINVDLAPAALALSPCHKFLYVVCYVDGKPGTGKLNVISTKSHRIITTVSGLFGPFGIDVTKDGMFAYVTNFGSNDFAPYGTNVSVVDLHDYRIVKNIEVGIQPSGIVVGDHFAYVSCFNELYAKSNFQQLTAGESTVNVISLKCKKVVAPAIPIGQTGSTLSLTHNGKKLYVCKYVQNTVARLSV